MAASLELARSQEPCWPTGRGRGLTASAPGRGVTRTWRVPGAWRPAASPAGRPSLPAVLGGGVPGAGNGLNRVRPVEEADMIRPADGACCPPQPPPPWCTAAGRCPPLASSRGAGGFEAGIDLEVLRRGRRCWRRRSAAWIAGRARCLPRRRITLRPRRLLAGRSRTRPRSPPLFSATKRCWRPASAQQIGQVSQRRIDGAGLLAVVLRESSASRISATRIAAPRIDSEPSSRLLRAARPAPNRADRPAVRQPDLHRAVEEEAPWPNPLEQMAFPQSQARSRRDSRSPMDA